MLTPQCTPKKSKLLISTNAKQSTPAINQVNVNGSGEKSISENSAKRNKAKCFVKDQYINDPDRFIQDEPRPKLIDEDSFDNLSDNDEFDPFWNLADETQDEEVEYMEAIQKEMKHLQVLLFCKEF